MGTKIYCDTNTLVPNMSDKPAELESFKQLWELHQAGKCLMQRSNIVRAELERTANVDQRERLKAAYDLLEPVPANEKLLIVRPVYGPQGWQGNVPVFADVQDQKIFGEIFEQAKSRLPREPELNTRRDAQHLAQAIHNGCDVFLTCDRKTIIEPLGKWLEERFPPLKIRLPSQIIAEIKA